MKYGDLIDRQAATKTALEFIVEYLGGAFDEDLQKKLMERMNALPFAQPGWIPFKLRPVTEEEKEEHPDWEYILDCKLPDDGQRILINIKYRGHEAVQMDEYFDDDGCYLDSGYEIATEATAWMPLPEPYKEKANG